MLAFLIFGGFWFWFFFIVCSVILLYNSIFSDHLFGIWVTGILLFVLFILSGGINFAWLIANPLTALMWIGIYIGAGLIWSMKEWYSYVKERINFNAHYIKDDATEDEIKYGLLREVDIKNHWGDITTWIVYFPYFVISWALTDPIKKIAQQFSFVYNKISLSLVNRATTKIVNRK